MSTRSNVKAFLTVAAIATALGTAPPWAHAELFVVDEIGNAVRMYNQTDGTSLGNFVDNTDIDAPRQMGLPRAAVFGNDGNLFVSGFNSNAVHRYTVIGGNLGKFVDNSFVTFSEARGIAFRGGLVYVANGQNVVMRFDPTKSGNQAFVDTFASNAAIDNPEGIAFGPDGSLYVANRGDGKILRFNGTTGALIGALSNGISGLTSPDDMAFGADGRLYVADESLSGKIARFNVSTPPGQFVDFFVDNDAGLSSPHCLTFGPGGKLFVGDSGNSSIRRYTATGGPDGVFVTAGSGGLVTPFDIFFSAPGGGQKLILTFHWWGLLALTALVGALQLRHRRALARAQAR